ncbi:unnamed protein product, partial [Effrenium voratum]
MPAGLHAVPLLPQNLGATSVAVQHRTAQGRPGCNQLPCCYHSGMPPRAVDSSAASPARFGGAKPGGRCPGLWLP